MIPKIHGLPRLYADINRDCSRERNIHGRIENLRNKYAEIVEGYKESMGEAPVAMLRKVGVF